MRNQSSGEEARGRQPQAGGKAARSPQSQLSQGSPVPSACPPSSHHPERRGGERHVAKPLLLLGGRGAKSWCSLLRHEVPPAPKELGGVEGDQAKLQSPRETKVSQKQAVKGGTRRCHRNAGVMSGPQLPAAAPTGGLFAGARAQHPWVAQIEGGRLGQDSHLGETPSQH